MNRTTAIADALKMTRLADSAPAWAILRATNAPAVLSVLSAVFQSDNRQIAGTELTLAVESLLIDIREQTDMSLPKSTVAYINDWVKAGYLTRRSPQGTREEFYELSTDAHVAIDYVQQLISPQRAVTKSRLSTLFNGLHTLAAETDPDEATAIRRLEQQRDQLQERIDQIRMNGVGVISDAEAKERAREILALASDLPTDFSRVREEIEEVDRSLRESIVEEQLSAGEVLDNVFRGVDLITESEAGKAFNGFYEVFLDPERSKHFDAAVASVLSRSFVTQLDPLERTELAQLVDTLDTSSGQVHESMTGLSRSLKRFVQSREAESQQALTKAINTAQQLALQLAQRGIKPSELIEFDLELTTRQPTSLSSWKLFDPMEYRIEPDMEINESGEINLEAMRERIRESEIDWEELRGAVNDVVSCEGRASISEVLSAHPATQGLASVVGLIKLAHDHGERVNGTEFLHWQRPSGKRFRARYARFEFGKTIGRS
ncbi:DUF3375 domain-containing protein [Corynebacterium auriscanis]|uniref:DUF3375 domain-containing protein n=1 Tax=Corynebacterium auriscanis TaxID=99807 RepID=UPI0022460C31|nr:DUF3375 domain-containing protein [Corynebacterium auriscanis]MCX2164107.1 DUF3375 domain-containing protein [Corynebacterium auriscanis]